MRALTKTRLCVLTKMRMCVLTKAHMHLVNKPVCREGFAGLFVPCEPVVDEPSGDAHAVGQGGEVVAAEESGVGQLLGLQSYVACGISRREAYHDARGERPRLAAIVPQVADAQAGLFHDLAPYTLLECLARLHEARHEAVVIAAEVVRPHEQYLVVALDAHYDGRMDRRKYLEVACSAAFADGGETLCRRAACRAVTAVAVPINYLRGLARSREVGGVHGREEWAQGRCGDVFGQWCVYCVGRQYDVLRVAIVEAAGLMQGEAPGRQFVAPGQACRTAGQVPHHEVAPCKQANLCVVHLFFVQI